MKGRSHVAVPANVGAFTRAKVEPMARGLFTRVEQDTVHRSAWDAGAAQQGRRLRAYQRRVSAFIPRPPKR